MHYNELEQLTTEELEARLAEKEDEQSQCKIMQMGIKVTLNSAYGMLGNEYSRYYDTRLAEAITMSGQFAIKWIKRKLNEGLSKAIGVKKLDFMVAGDTDSVYLTLSPIVDVVAKDKTEAEIVRFLDRVCAEKIEVIIEEGYQELADYANASQQKMRMKRELIASKGVWRAKKNYALMVHNSEGVSYAKPKCKIKGMESTRSAIPGVCRDAFADAVEIALQKTEADVQKYVADFRKSYIGWDVEKISFPRGVKELEKYTTEIDHMDSYDGMHVSDLAVFKPSTPAHVSGALLYNRLLKYYGVENQYPAIRSGDKLKFCYIMKHNPTRHHVIAFDEEIPPEFGLDKYIDVELQYEKSFLSPIKSVLTLFGWSHKKRNNLMGFFKG